MALQCQMGLNTFSVNAGQTAYATLTVYNPNAVPVVVTSALLRLSVLGDTGVNHMTMTGSIIPLIAGAPSTVAALGTSNFGPIAINLGSAAASNAFQTIPLVNAGGISTLSAQPSQPISYVVLVGADVTGSDGSVNQAGTAPLVLSPAVGPQVNSQGGVLMSQPSNSLTMLVL